MTAATVPTRPASLAVPLMRRKGVRLALRYLIAVLLVIVFLFPIYWLFMMSFKTPGEIFAYPPVWYPKSLQFKSYIDLFPNGDAA